jgi:hypothetical protein
MDCSVQTDLVFKVEYVAVHDSERENLMPGNYFFRVIYGNCPKYAHQPISSTIKLDYDDFAAHSFTESIYRNNNETLNNSPTRTTNC